MPAESGECRLAAPHPHVFPCFLCAYILWLAARLRGRRVRVVLNVDRLVDTGRLQQIQPLPLLQWVHRLVAAREKGRRLSGGTLAGLSGVPTPAPASTVRRKRRTGAQGAVSVDVQGRGLPTRPTSARNPLRRLGCEGGRGARGSCRCRRG